MKALSTSEEQVMAALWACGKPATRRQIAAKLPPDCVWADSTLLNFLLRLEAKGYVRPEKQGNKNIYTPLVRRVTYCGAVSAEHLRTLYAGDPRRMMRALADTGRITIYYGAADTVTGMAFTTVDELLSYMRKYPHEV